MAGRAQAGAGLLPLSITWASAWPQGCVCRTRQGCSPARALSAVTCLDALSGSVAALSVVTAALGQCCLVLPCAGSSGTRGAGRQGSVLCSGSTLCAIRVPAATGLVPPCFSRGACEWPRAAPSAGPRAAAVFESLAESWRTCLVVTHLPSSSLCLEKSGCKLPWWQRQL